MTQFHCSFNKIKAKILILKFKVLNNHWTKVAKEEIKNSRVASRNIQILATKLGIK
jgi:hypothetical protein